MGYEFEAYCVLQGHFRRRILYINNKYLENVLKIDITSDEAHEILDKTLWRGNDCDNFEKFCPTKYVFDFKSFDHKDFEDLEYILNEELMHNIKLREKLKGYYDEIEDEG